MHENDDSRDLARQRIREARAEAKAAMAGALKSSALLTTGVFFIGAVGAWIDETRFHMPSAVIFSLLLGGAMYVWLRRNIKRTERQKIESWEKHLMDGGAV